MIDHAQIKSVVLAEIERGALILLLVNEVRGVIVVASAWPALAALPWWPL